MADGEFTWEESESSKWHWAYQFMLCCMNTARCHGCYRLVLLDTILCGLQNFQVDKKCL
jgi:hypothetical protein